MAAPSTVVPHDEALQVAVDQSQCQVTMKQGWTQMVSQATLFVAQEIYSAPDVLPEQLQGQFERKWVDLPLE